MVIIGLALPFSLASRSHITVYCKKMVSENIVKNQIISKTHRSFCSALHD